MGLAGVGFASAFNIIPSLPEMMETIEADEKFQDTYAKKDIETVISSLYVTFHSLGEMAGPFFNSILMSEYGFRMSH